MAMNFYKSKEENMMVLKLSGSDAAIAAGGKEMKQLKAGVSDGAVEKHVPAVEVDGKVVRVQVGSVEHPMLDVHYIEWIALESKEGLQVKYLEPGIKPYAEFVLSESDEPVAVYEYCNLHGLWKAEC